MWIGSLKIQSMPTPNFQNVNLQQPYEKFVTQAYRGFYTNNN